MKFEQWMMAVDEICKKKYYVSIHDLPDQPFMDWFEDEMTPQEAADTAIEDM